MPQHLARAKIKRALHHNPPPATDQTYQPGDEVLVWIKKQVEDKIGEWLVPYIVVTYDAPFKVVVVQKYSDSAHERFSVAQIKLFLRPNTAAASFMDTLHASPSMYVNPQEQPSDVVSPIQSIYSSYKHDKLTDQFISDTSLSARNTEENFNNPAIHVTEVIDKNDPSAMCHEMHEAKVSEIRNLLQRGTFRVILKEELREGANELRTMFVIAMNRMPTAIFSTRHDISSVDIVINLNISRFTVHKHFNLPCQGCCSVLHPCTLPRCRPLM